MTNIFQLTLKTAKVLPVFKKDSKLDYSNYRKILLSSNIKNISFSVVVVLSNSYNLGSGSVVIHLLLYLI